MGERNLTEDEITILERRGCTASDWYAVKVAPDFTPGRSFHNVHFSGSVQLGTYTGTVRTSEGFAFPCGIGNSFLHNVSVGNDCLIRHVHAAGVDIGDNVFLDRVDMISRLGDTAFANGLAATVLTEDGGRSVPLWRGLTAQMAHLLCHFKNHPAARALEEMIRRDADTLRQARSYIASGCRIRRTGQLRNVWVGEAAAVDGVYSLENCYIDSSRETPARLGEGVAARDTVFLRSCLVECGASLNRCLVGEGVRVSSGFSGKNSLFFANSDFGLGEADAAMAGPYATSLHKATLVLTCQCSFATFGSAANSSNHHFKLGPRHGGVLRRGVKCGSGSYIFWPSDIGAFTTVVGRHAGHLDTVNFPFSLLVGEQDKSILVPGVNLFSAGTFRDAEKWRQRDRRTGVEDPRDLVNPAILSPYVLQAMDAGSDLLRRCLGFAVDVRHGGAVIPANRVGPALKLYETALVFHLGERLFDRASRAKGGAFPETEDLRRQLLDLPDDAEEQVQGEWRDWGGMLLPGAQAARIVTGLEGGGLPHPDALRERLEEMHQAYARFEWLWLALRWRRDYGEPSDHALLEFTAKWRRAVTFRLEAFIKDASKEFTPEVRFGYGVEEESAIAFRRVRGVLSEHPLVIKAEAERERLLALTRRIPTPD